MNKLIFLVSFLACAFLAQAQESTTFDNQLDYNQTWFTYSQTTPLKYANTATDSVWFWTTLKNSYYGVKYDIKVDLDSVGGTKQTVPVVLSAKKNLSDTWTIITTTNWKLGRDTVVLFTQTGTSQYYKYWKVSTNALKKGFIFRVKELTEIFWY